MRTNQRIATVFLSGIAIAFGLVWLLGDSSALLPDRPPGLEYSAVGTVPVHAGYRSLIGELAASRGN